MVSRVKCERVLRRDHCGFALHLRGNVVCVKPHHLHHQRFLVVASEEQQTFDKLLHAFRLLRDGVDALVQHIRVALAPAGQHAGIPLNDGNRCPKLVRSVGNELLLAVVGCFDAVEHGVDDRCKVFQLIFCPGDVDAVGEVVRGERRCHVGDIANRREDALLQPLPMQDEVEHAEQVSDDQRRGSSAVQRKRAREAERNQQRLPRNVLRLHDVAPFGENRLRVKQAVGALSHDDAVRARFGQQRHFRVIQHGEGNGAVCGQRRALQPRNVAFSEVQRAARERQRQDEQRGEKRPHQLEGKVGGDAEGEGQANAGEGGRQPVWLGRGRGNILLAADAPCLRTVSHRRGTCSRRHGWCAAS